ncbi:MAG TPA: hypothetical protein PKM44_02290 [Turneriella sp.]|nr:hypothetical protein [Turneriella sp.]HNL09313.1 hypothetical protein [Turneriella sp.]
MKKILAMLAVLSLIGAVHAQKKAKPAAKAAAKVDAAKADADAKAKAAQGAANAKAADVQNKANEKLTSAAASVESKMSVAVWGGYNFASSTFFSDLEKTIKDSETSAGFSTSKSPTQTKGGIAAGADLMLGGDFKYGLGLAYLQIYKLDWTNSEAGTTAKITSNIAFAPIHAQAQYIIGGLKLGVGAGISLGTGETKTEVTGSETTTTKVKGSSFSASASVAYGFDFDGVSADVGVRYYAIFDDKMFHNIVPSVTIGYKF